VPRVLKKANLYTWQHFKKREFGFIVIFQSIVYTHTRDMEFTINLWGSIVYPVIIAILYKAVEACLIQVPEGYVVILEKFGKMDIVLGPGYYFYPPIMYVIKKIKWDNNITIERIFLKNQIYDAPPVKLVSRDYVEVNIDVIVHFMFVDPKKVAYNSYMPGLELKTVVDTGVREACASLTWDQLNVGGDEKHKIAGAVKEKFSNFEERLGIRITEVAIERIFTNEKTMQQWDKIVSAKKTAELNMITQESEKKKQLIEKENEIALKLMTAESEAKLTLMKQQTEANSIKAIADAESYRRDKASEAESKYIKSIIATGVSENYFNQSMMRDNWKALTQSKGSNLIVPYEVTQFLGLGKVLNALTTGTPGQ
jgi:regulator of protease activity HflC (stomatin/prohibitin superfamily)